MTPPQRPKKRGRWHRIKRSLGRHGGKMLSAAAGAAGVALGREVVRRFKARKHRPMGFFPTAKTPGNPP